MSDTDTGDDPVVYFTAPAEGFDCGHVCCSRRPLGEMHPHGYGRLVCSDCAAAEAAIQQPGPRRSPDRDSPPIAGFVTGPVAHVKGADTRLYACLCRHGRAWVEGADWGDVSGSACRECSEEAPHHQPTQLALPVALRANEMRKAVEELAPAMLGQLRQVPGTVVPIGPLPAPPAQPTLSAGDAQRIVGMAQELAAYRAEQGLISYDDAEAALVTWLEQWLYPEMYAVELPMATNRHPSNGRPDTA